MKGVVVAGMGWFLVGAVAGYAASLSGGVVSVVACVQRSFNSLVSWIRSMFLT